MKRGGVLLYGAGQLGIMLLARFYFQWVLRFSEVGKESATGPLLLVSTVGLIVLGFRFVDAVADPLIGAFSDSWVTRGRQRRSLIWISFLLPPLGLALAFAPHADMAAALRWTLFSAGTFLFFVGYTLYAIPYWSLVEDYSRGDEKTRTSLSNALGVGLLLATAIGFVVSPLLIEKTNFWIAAVIFALVGIPLLVLPYFAHPEHIGAETHPDPPPLGQVLRSTLTDRPFLAVILLFAGGQMSLTIMTSAAVYIAERILQGSLEDVPKLLGPFLLTAIPTFVFVPRITARFGWEKTALWATVALGLCYAGTGLLGRALVGTPITTAMLVFACAGPGAAFVLGLEGEAIARSAERSEHRSTSIYFGVYNFVVKALNGVALFITGLLAEQGSVGAIRAMPILAGGLCVSGVGLYLLTRPRTEHVARQS